MASRLMKSVSGIRGIVGDTLTPELILKVGSAFAKYTRKGTIVLGRDSRASGDAIARSIESVLMLSGCDVIDLGIVPTPTVQLMVEELKANGGIVVSASHNPVEWNAFKFINKYGTFLNSKDIARMFSFMDLGFKYEKWDKIGKIKFNSEAETIHIDRVIGKINHRDIAKEGFRVVLDSVNGAGSIITPRFLSKLGCEIIPVFCDITGSFPRGAEPLTKNLTELSRMVSETSADVGFAQDPDADRLAIVDEMGNPIGEENTISLVVEHLLSKKLGRVVINLSTTKTVEAIASKYGVKVKRTRVGEINVVEDMRRYGARIGGEGNGGVISPDVHLGRDSLVGIGYILEMMSERGKTISQLVSDLPCYVIKKGIIKYDKHCIDEDIFIKIRNEFREEKISELDGLRIDFVRESEFKDGWIHLRSSNTEPIFRIISEGRDNKQADKIYNHFVKMLK